MAEGTVVVVQVERAKGHRRALARMVPAAARPWLAITLALAWAEIRRDGSRNLAGLLWWLADPLVNLVIYYIVFTRVFVPTVPNFLSFLLLNLMVWRWISVAVTQASSAVLTNAGLLRQIYIPKAVLVGKFVVTESAAFGIGTLLVLVTFLLDSQRLHSTLVLILPLAILSVVHIFSIGLLLGLIAPYMPDVTQILNFALRGLGIMSGIFFDPASFSGTTQRIIYLNPWACLLDSYRAVALRGELPSSSRIAYVIVLTGLLLVCGVLLHNRLDRKITKALR